MTETQKKFDKIENKLRVRYSKLSKVFLIIAFLFTIWIVFVALGVFILEKGPDWTLLTLDNWVYAWCVLIGFFIVLEVFFYLHYVFVRNRRLEQEKPRSEFYRGKRLHVYTHPRGVEGGVFSKTYIQIDGYSMLRLRTLMIPPGDLWSKK